MLSIRRPWWAALALAAFAAGCSSEPASTSSETPSTTTTTAPASSTPTPTPVTAPDKAADAGSKGAMKAETAAEPSKTTDDAPAPEAPGLKIEAPTVEPPAKAAPAPKADQPKEKEAAATKLTEEEVAEIKRLPADEQAAALKQVLCPVSGEHLGSMEAPIKVTAEGKTFYLCCASCKKEVEKNPKDVIAKLGSK